MAKISAHHFMNPLGILMVLSLAVVGLGTIFAVSSTQQTTQTQSEAAGSSGIIYSFYAKKSGVCGATIASGTRLKNIFTSNSDSNRKTFWYKFTVVRMKNGSPAGEINNARMPDPIAIAKGKTAALPVNGAPVTKVATRAYGNGTYALKMYVFLYKTNDTTKAVTSKLATAGTYGSSCDGGPLQ